MFYGAVDEVWVNTDGELILSDVKNKSKNIFDWEDTWNKFGYPKGYRRQLEVYEWRFRKNGFKVFDKAYLVYYNGLKKLAYVNQVLIFELHLVELKFSDNSFEETLVEAKKMLECDEYP